MTKKICIITSSARSIIQFRTDLIKELVSLDKQVVVITFDHDNECEVLLSDLGVSMIVLNTHRTSLNLFHNLFIIAKLLFSLRSLRPETVFTYFIKPNIFGICAAALVGIKKRVMLLEGLGYIFTDTSFLTKYILRVAVMPLYIVAFNLSSKVIVLNEDDKRFVAQKIFSLKDKVVLMRGIGVNPVQYRKIEGFKTEYDFLFVGRYLKHKGIHEYFSALRKLKAKGYQFRAVIAGGLDLNPSSLTETELRVVVSEGLVEDLGYVKDMNIVYNQSRILVLPSYREARPRVVQEALVCGLPCIVSSAPGCHDAIENGVQGMVVDISDESQLANAMQAYLDSPDLHKKHAANAIKFGRLNYDVHSINNKFLEHLLT